MISIVIILVLLPSFLLGEERTLEEFPSCLYNSDCPATTDICIGFFCINLNTAKADLLCDEGEEEACESGSCRLVDGTQKKASEYTKRRGVCLDTQEISCDSEGAQCGPELVCLGGICAPKFYKEDLINKTDCQTHEFCQRSDLGGFCCMDFTADDEATRRRCCNSALELVMPNTAGGREKLNTALLSSDMEEKLEAVCRSDALKEHLSSMEACQEFVPKTTTTEASTTTSAVEPTEASGISEEHSEEQPGQDTKAKEVQALTSLANLSISETLPLLLLMVVLLLLNFL